MIVPDETLFPNNVVNLVAIHSQLIDPDLFVTKRPLRNTDPNQSVGVSAVLWTPDDDSTEMRGGPYGPSEPTLSTYRIAIQAFIKDMDEIKGLATHSVLSKRVRNMLYRDAQLRIGLASLSTSMSEVTERAQRWGVATQRYFSNELNGSWLYLSTLEFWLETETI